MVMLRNNYFNYEMNRKMTDKGVGNNILKNNSENDKLCKQARQARKRIAI